ncbi:MAG: hypothetical protein PHX04_00575 [Bacilli bacterium]|nr:hypothetical protein [Bacilli bacterium]
MNEHIQIALFFPERIIYDPTRVANAFLEKLPELKQPIILPFDIGPNQEGSGIPVVVFDQSSDIKLTLTFNNFVLTLFNDKRKEKKEIIKKIFNVINVFQLNFSRIGYVNNTLMPESDVLKFKSDKFKDPEIIKAEEFQLGWYNKITIDELTVNFWQRFNTNKSISNNVFVSYDLNTLIENIHEVDYKFAINFINNVDNWLSK